MDRRPDVDEPEDVIVLITCGERMLADPEITYMRRVRVPREMEISMQRCGEWP